MIQGGFSEVDGYHGFMNLYKSGSLPEFIFAVTFPAGLGVYRAVNELGLKIPDDVDLICFGNSGLNHFLAPPMSYVEQPTVDLGRRAMELTIEQIRRPEQFVSQQIKLPTNLVLCKTCIRKVATGRDIREQRIANA
jgi:LacI family transcriptional regulator